MSIPSPIRSALLLAAVILAATGCDSHPFAGSERDTPRRDGPLDELTYPGGVSINRPAHAGEEWAGSFGCLALCLDKDGAEARIERVRVLETEGTVQDLTAYVATPEEGHRGDLLFISTRGRAPEFAEPYAQGSAADARGYTFAPAEGATVRTHCGQPRKEPNLALTFSTDRRGGSVKEWEVIYTSDGIRYTTGPVPGRSPCAEPAARSRSARPVRDRPSGSSRQRAVPWPHPETPDGPPRLDTAARRRRYVDTVIVPMVLGR